MKQNFVDLGEKTLKNIVRPVRTYAVKSETADAATSHATLAPDKAGPPRLSIAAQPFANFGGDPEQDDFVDGVTEILTTDLSRIDSAFMIARNTAFTHKGKGL